VRLGSMQMDKCTCDCHPLVIEYHVDAQVTSPDPNEIGAIGHWCVLELIALSHAFHAQNTMEGCTFARGSCDLVTPTKGFYFNRV
jgi:hypothetical protein